MMHLVLVMAMLEIDCAVSGAGVSSQDAFQRSRVTEDLMVITASSFWWPSHIAKESFPEKLLTFQIAETLRPLVESDIQLIFL